MDKDLKDALMYGGGTIFGYSAFLTLLLQFTKDTNLLTIYTLFLIVFIWLFYIQLKLSKKIGGKNDKK